MKHLLLILAFIPFYESAYSQDPGNLKNRADTIRFLTKLIADDGTLTSIGTGYAGMPSKQYYRFLFLLTMMNNDEFVQLANNSSGSLRVYAYMALYHNRYNELTKIQDQLKNDKTKIFTVSGCTIDTISICNIVSQITNWYWEEQTKEVVTQLITNKEYRDLEFEILCGPDK